MKSFDEILAKAAELGKKKVALAGEPDEELDKAIAMADQRGIAEAVPFATAPEAVAAVRRGECDILMKGSAATGDFLKAILDHDHGLRAGQLISHIAVIEVNGKFFLVTDSGICLNPTLEEKVEIIKNAIPLAEAFGMPNPKVAALAAVEKVNPKMPETVEAQKLAEMNIPGCVVQGPLAVDNAISARAAAVKGITGPVAGKANILLVPSVLSGNMFGKAIMYFAECRFGGLVAGTTKPVCFLSRADTAETKLNTMALGVLLCDKK